MSKQFFLTFFHVFLCIWVVSARCEMRLPETSLVFSSDGYGTIQQQKAQYIFNFAEQVSWSSYANEGVFTVGVLGNDPILENLRQMAKDRSIHGRSVIIRRINSIRGVSGIDVLYAGKEYKSEVTYIKSEIRGKRILLVTEDFDFNTSMINMIRVGESYQYEINKRLIRRAKLAVASSLEKYAISSRDRWEELFKFTEEQLVRAKQENEAQKQLIEKQREEIGNKESELEIIEEAILEKESSIKSLSRESRWKNKKLREKILMEEKLEERIQEQLCQLEEQQAQISESETKIEEQKRFLTAQNAEIAKKEEILEEKSIIIFTQKRNNLILLILIGLLMLAGLWIYRSFLRDRKLNNKLEAQHLAISKQSDQLVTKNKELEQFAYIASHDLQEPLNTISSFIDLIRMEYDDKLDSDGKESLGFIKEASTRMKKLIDALLQYSRLGRGRNFEMVNIEKVISDLRADLKLVIEDNSATIKSFNLPTAKGNEIELRLLFQNLISNGIKFRTDEAVPEIIINCRQVRAVEESTGRFWEFSVKDNGIGIPAEHQDRIFGIFQRLHSREDFKGAGIGLAHCKKIVESHGGKIWLESQVGAGSTFYFTIPCAE